jgi:soluble lytic murein transglycosylase
MANNSRHARQTKGHGCIGFFAALILAAIAIVAVLFFSTNVLDGVKDRVYTIFYPQKYTESVERYSAQFGVDKNLVYAVIRTESGFREEVESHAGAVGLMQLMPETFSWLQDNLDGEVIYPAEKLKDPDINIRYGTYFLSYLIGEYGDVRTACAAYNAGMSNVEYWLSDSRYSPDGHSLSVIPYQETAGYVEKVEQARQIYARIY